MKTTSHTLMEQFWFGNSCQQQLLGVVKSPIRCDSHVAVLFFPGFGQTSAGSNFLFTQISHRLCQYMHTFQFDYYGWGDSQGETFDCNQQTLLRDARIAVSELRDRTKCKHFLFIGESVMSNWIAAQMAKEQSDECTLILLCPNTSLPSLKLVISDEIFSCISSTSIVNTARLGDWSPHSPLFTFFLQLGASRGYSKGLLLRWQFLCELAEMNVPLLLQSYMKPIIEFYQPEQEPLTSLGDHETIALPIKRMQFPLDNPHNRDFIIETLVTYSINFSKISPEILT